MSPWPLLIPWALQACGFLCRCEVCPSRGKADLVNSPKHISSQIPRPVPSWHWCPNPYSEQVLRACITSWEVHPDQKLLFPRIRTEITRTLCRVVCCVLPRLLTECAFGLLYWGLKAAHADHLLLEFQPIRLLFLTERCVWSLTMVAESNPAGRLDALLLTCCLHSYPGIWFLYIQR